MVMRLNSVPRQTTLHVKAESLDAKMKVLQLSPILLWLPLNALTSKASFALTDDQLACLLE